MENIIFFPETPSTTPNEREAIYISLTYKKGGRTFSKAENNMAENIAFLSLSFAMPCILYKIRCRNVPNNVSYPGQIAVVSLK